MQGLLFAGIGDLGNWWHTRSFRLSFLWLPIWRVTNAAIVAITHCKDAALAPHLALQLPWLWLLRHLQILVEVDPASTTRTLVAESFLGHEKVRSLDAHADVRVVGTIGEFNCFPKVWIFWLILETIELLDADSGHVL